MDQHNGLMPITNNLPDATPDNLPDRYHQFPLLSSSGAVDRRHEGQHVLRMRDLQRRALESAAVQAEEAIEHQAWLEARGRASTETKYRLLRNAKETQVLAGEDPVLQAEMNLIDDQFFQEARLKLGRWQ